MLPQVPGDIHDSDPHSGRPRCGSSEPNMVDAHCARARCYTPTVNRKAQPSGNSGSRPPAKRDANTRSPYGELARRTNAPQPASYTPTAAATPATALGQHHCPPVSLEGLPEPVARKAGTARFRGGPGAGMRRGYPTNADSPSYVPLDIGRSSCNRSSLQGRGAAGGPAIYERVPPLIARSPLTPLG
jgi:hypothetical protein